MEKIKYLKMTLLFLFTLCVIYILVTNVRNTYLKNIQNDIIKKTITNLEKTKETEENKQKEKIVFEEDTIGLIVIPSIDVRAPIKEGTSSDVLKYTVGHFEETSLWNGNVALASHNEGSYAHYFEKIKQLKNGEEIIYITNMGERRYSVYENKIIKETNVGILENTKENIITLITCVTNKRQYRQCVIAKEII